MGPLRLHSPCPRKQRPSLRSVGPQATTLHGVWMQFLLFWVHLVRNREEIFSGAWAILVTEQMLRVIGNTVSIPIARSQLTKKPMCSLIACVCVCVWERERERERETLQSTEPRGVLLPGSKGVIAYSRGVKLIFTGGHISLAVAFKGPK